MFPSRYYPSRLFPSRYFARTRAATQPATWDLAQARLDAAAYFLFDSCTIVTITTTTDAGGAPVEAETSITSPCAFDRVSGGEAEPDIIQERGSYRLKLPRAASIDATSQVVFSGRRYRVVWTPPLANIGLTRLIGLELIGKEGA